MPDGNRLGWALTRDLRQVARLDLKTQFDLFHAILELAIARLRLSTRKAKELLGSTNPAPSQSPPETANSLIDRVSFAVPRMGVRVPWRGDCLVQAVAAQSWLGRHRIETVVVIGVRKGTTSDLDAHAWLMAGERMVTGGEVDAYQVIHKQMLEPWAKRGAARRR